MGKSFKRNVAGCDPRYSFHYTGTDNQLFVFEAPIDLLSFVTLYPDDWQSHSYVALCGTSSHAMLWMLEQNPQLQCVALCLDHDEAGMKATQRLMGTLKEKGYTLIGQCLPDYKDWNENLKAEHSMPAQAAEEPEEVPTMAMTM